ncbi:MAG: hypothetical protein IH586_06690 [Anaerolineaceae bacterium]|nr:hypothetical protein [Anaerolineaceae bacterium]
MSQALSVILVCQTRLLREMFTRAIAKIPGLRVVNQIDQPAGLQDALQKHPADWVIFAIEPAQGVPPLVDAAIAAYPGTHFFSISADGEHFTLRWMEPHDQNLDDTTLAELAANLH